MFTQNHPVLPWRWEMPHLVLLLGELGHILSGMLVDGIQLLHQRRQCEEVISARWAMKGNRVRTWFCSTTDALILSVASWSIDVNSANSLVKLSCSLFSASICWVEMSWMSISIWMFALSLTDLYQSPFLDSEAIAVDQQTLCHCFWWVALLQGSSWLKRLCLKNYQFCGQFFQHYLQSSHPIQTYFLFLQEFLRGLQSLWNRQLNIFAFWEGLNSI